MVVLALATILVSIAGYFLWQRSQDIKSQLIEASDNSNEAKTSLKEATSKIDATINTLFESDRDIIIQATCNARGKMCPLNYGNMVCHKRRDGSERRKEEGHGKDPP